MKDKPRQRTLPAILMFLLEAVDRRAFRDPDIDAIARGWQVRRLRRFHRSYRDPRWDLVSVCGSCGGAGMVGARICGDCDGDGRIIAGPVENVGVS
jgi:hypothetical protein